MLRFKKTDNVRNFYSEMKQQIRIAVNLCL